MLTGPVYFRNVGPHMEDNAQPADWFEEALMITVCGRVFRRYRQARLYRAWNGRIFLKLEKYENPGEEIRALCNGVYFHIPQSTRLRDYRSPPIKAGMHSAGSVIRMCRYKGLLGQNEGLWTMRRKILQGIAENYSWLDSSVYELTIGYSSYLPVGIHSLIPNTRRPDFAAGPISDQETKALAEHLQSWRRRRTRTEPVDVCSLTEAVNDLYSSFGLKPPPIVLVPSPFVLAMAGSFAVALRWAHKQGAAQPDASARAFERVITGELNEASTGCAYHAIGSTIDNETLRQFEKLIDDSGEAGPARGRLGAAGQVVEHALLDASNRDFEPAFSDQPEAFKTSLAGEILQATRLACDIEPDRNKPTDLQFFLDKFDYLLPNKVEASSFATSLAHTLSGGNRQIRDLMLSCLNSCNLKLEIGNLQRYDECLTTSLARVLKLKLAAQAENQKWQRVVSQCGAILLHEDFCMVSEYPQVVEQDENSRPHCAEGPSYVYRDGWSLFHWRGIRVSRQLIEKMETVTVNDIKREPNIEIRRILVERYGDKRFLQDSDAEEIARDESGVLYRKVIHTSLDPIVMVKVVNATPEPDGSFKEYYLRVPPHIITAKQAVAWTFGMTSQTYKPLVQS